MELCSFIVSLSLRYYIPVILFQVLVAVSPRSNLQFFDVGTKTWKLLPVCAPAIQATHCYSAVSATDKLIVAASDSLGHCLYRYDREANVWERLTHSGSEIQHLCVTEEHIYAFPADCTGYPQGYNFSRRKWERFQRVGITFGVSNSYFYSGIAVLNDKVYVLYVEKCQTYLNQAVLHCFDPQKNQWEKKANTSQFHFGSSLLVVNGKLYVAGGNVSCDRTHRPYGNRAPVEMYNEETNAWTVVEHKNVPADSNLGAVEIEGRVYFIINQFPYDSGIRLAHGELNYTVLQEWENLAKINQGAVLSYLAVKRFEKNESCQEC